MAQALVRPRHGKVIAGVCAALADRFGLSRTLVRIGFVLFGLFGVGELVYIVLWIVVPKADRY
jgi:phage shock protein C